MTLKQMSVHCFISGKVQGVWFRASTKEQAEKLGITGWVRNLQDGRVEVIACGDKEAIAAFYAWLKHGPELAKVTDITYEEITWKDFPHFETR